MKTSNINARADASGLRCPACNGLEIGAVGFKVEQLYELYQCGSCEMSFLDLRGFPDADEAVDEYWDDVNVRVYSEPTVIAELRAKYRRYFGCLAERAPNKRFLDVGSGAGISVDTAASEYGFEAMGVEPSTVAVNLSKRQYEINIVQGILYAEDSLPRDFGVLTLWDVIEHVKDPEGLLRDCADHLVDQGLLVLETPDERAFIRRVINWIGRLGFHRLDRRRDIYYRAHRYYFSRDAMARLLKRAGFTDIRFFSEKSIFSKELEKRRQYQQLPEWQAKLYKTIFTLIRVLPWLSNKMVVIASKDRQVRSPEINVAQ